jgi:hypothetical protein
VHYHYPILIEFFKILVSLTPITALQQLILELHQQRRFSSSTCLLNFVERQLNLTYQEEISIFQMPVNAYSAAIHSGRSQEKRFSSSTLHIKVCNVMFRYWPRMKN